MSFDKDVKVLAAEEVQEQERDEEDGEPKDEEERVRSEKENGKGDEVLRDSKMA